MAGSHSKVSRRVDFGHPRTLRNAFLVATLSPTNRKRSHLLTVRVGCYEVPFESTDFASADHFQIFELAIRKPRYASRIAFVCAPLKPFGLRRLIVFSGGATEPATVAKPSKNFLRVPQKGEGAVFAALDRAWPLVVLALTLLAPLSCMTLLGHLAIKIL